MTHRYPLEPLFALTGWSMNRVTEIAPCNGPEYRARLERGLTELHADRVAVAAGLHPHVVWPEMGEDLIRSAEIDCAADDCDQRFVPASWREKYCSSRCRNRVKTRRYRATEAGAQKAREVSNRYYWSDHRIRERAAELKARPSARRAEAARARARRERARLERQEEAA